MARKQISSMELIDTDEPEIRGPNDVLIDVSHRGVCGSHMHFYRSGHVGGNYLDFPFILGHEGAGIISGTGSSAGHLKPGQPIAIEPSMPYYSGPIGMSVLSDHKADMSSLIKRPYPMEKTDDAFQLVSAYGYGVMNAIIE